MSAAFTILIAAAAICITIAAVGWILAEMIAAMGDDE